MQDNIACLGGDGQAVDFELAGRRYWTSDATWRISADAFDSSHIAEGCGYDPAPAAIADARRLTGPRPLVFMRPGTFRCVGASSTWRSVTRLLYLIRSACPTLTRFTGPLVPGGLVLRRHGGPCGQPTHCRVASGAAAEPEVAPLHDLDVVAASFAAAGFEVAAPAAHWICSASAQAPRVLEWLELHNERTSLPVTGRPLSAEARLTPPAYGSFDNLLSRRSTSSGRPPPERSHSTETFGSSAGPGAVVSQAASA